jgi:hypothetical protein
MFCLVKTSGFAMLALNDVKERWCYVNKFVCEYVCECMQGLSEWQNQGFFSSSFLFKLLDLSVHQLVLGNSALSLAALVREKFS